MPEISPITLDVLRHLQVHGLQTKSEITKVLGTLPASTISNLHYLGHIAANTEQKDVRYVITPKGVEKLRNPNARRSPGQVTPGGTSAKPRTSGKQYGAIELTGSARPGAMVAYGLPSRVGNRLHWPDGRTTDLDHNPLE